MHKFLALMLVTPMLLVACAPSPEPGGPGLGGDPFADQGVSDNAVTGTGVPEGEVDCAAMSQQSLLTFTYGIQTLAQLGSQEAVDSVNDGSVVFDPESFADSLLALHALDGFAEEPYGDPADSLDYYADVNAAAENLLAFGTPIPESEFTSYSKVTGGSAQVIAEQNSISASYNANCAS